MGCAVKNHVIKILVMALGLLGAVTYASDWYDNYYAESTAAKATELRKKAPILARISERRKKQRDRARLLERIEAKPDLYDILLQMRDDYANQRPFTGGYKPVAPYEINNEIEYYNRHYIPGVMPYVKKSMGVGKGSRENYLDEKAPNPKGQPLPDIKEMIQQDYERKSIRHRFGNWVSSFYR